MAEHPPTQFLYRAARSFGVYYGPPRSDEVAEFKRSEQELRVMKYSATGQHLAWASTENVTITSAENYQTLAVIPETKVVALEFSPKGTYLMTYERFVKTAEGQVHRNLKIYRSADGSFLGSFTQKNMSDWHLQWPQDESCCAQLLNGTINFYRPTENMGNSPPDMKLSLEGLKSFSISPGLSPAVAVFIPERKGAPAAVRMYSLGSFTHVLANKSFYKAEKVEFIWHNLGTSLLVLTHTEVDNTGKSYYGETNLYYMTTAGNFDCRVPLNKEGPIHDVAWNPVEKEFVVVYGFIPSKASLFDSRANEVFSFGIEPRNTVRFNPQGRVLAIAGFGNLSGRVDIWDYKNRKMIKSVDAHGSSLCSWSPCGRYLMTATLSPRLRVDNGFKIYHYSGKLVHSREINELYGVEWRPAPASLYPQKTKLDPLPANISIVVENTKAKKDTPVSSKPVGVYRPPHARNSPIPDSSKPKSLAQRNNETENTRRSVTTTPQRYVPGAPPPKQKAPKAPKEGGNAKEKKETLKEPNSQRGQQSRSPKLGSGTPGGSPSNKSSVGGNESGLDNGGKTGGKNEAVKKFLNLQKKLKQIQVLQKRQEAGEELNEAQLLKIQSKALILKQIDELKQ
ncbi:hypothetical protein BB559_001827 [Furculomyces boomerangus]|uniref:Eukaryotic translation initiation factor 2A n=2 Tax=Harpellales TaxID=61421 RepID=A0A2T9Z095_9FUNG|nr:hypothetical protein BB559_001827 [Furculomyces boomerangus]PWA03761.1 hypothetical protein BB558_000063 [Smittium angustum]